MNVQLIKRKLSTGPLKETFEVSSTRFFVPLSLRNSVV